MKVTLLAKRQQTVTPETSQTTLIPNDPLHIRNDQGESTGHFKAIPGRRLQGHCGHVCSRGGVGHRCLQPHHRLQLLQKKMGMCKFRF